MYSPTHAISRRLSETQESSLPPESSSSALLVQNFVGTLDFDDISAIVRDIMNPYQSPPYGVADDGLESELRQRLAATLGDAETAVKAPLEELLMANLLAGALAMWLRLAHREPDATERILLRRRAYEWALREAAAMLTYFRARAVASVADAIRAACAAGHPADAAIQRLRQQLAHGGPIEKQFSGHLNDGCVAGHRYGGLVAAGALGYASKFWISEQDARVCGVCNLNESQAPIPLDAAFHSGHLHPPAHPNCRCWLDFK